MVPREIIKILCLIVLAFALGVYATFRFLVVSYSINNFEDVSNHTFSEFNCTERNLLNISGIALKACILENSVYVQLCQGQPYFTSCLLLEDLDLVSLCRNVPLDQIKSFTGPL